MKSNYSKIFCLLTAAFLMQSCDKELDVRPKQSIDASTALTTASDVDAALIGTYSLMSAGSLYGTNLFMIADLQAGEGYASWRGTFQGQRDIANKTMTRDNAEAARTWNQAYRTINMANVVLDAVDVVTDQELQDQYKGEALFIRGALHFELVRYFAKPWGASAGNDHIGIVLRTEPHLTEAPASPRSTVKQVYDQVIADLTEAASKLPEENGRRVDKYTALAFLARVYLQQSDFAKALDASNQVIESGMYEMNNDLLAAFTQDNTPEVIWEIEQDVQNNAGTSNDGLATFYGSIPGVGRGDVRIDAAFVNSYAANDLRKTAYYYVGTGARPGNLYSAKWTSFSQNLPVVRLAEMYLVRAECNIRLGSSVGDSPTNDLAQIRNMARVGLPPIANPTLADVLKERTYELAFEGLRIHDIKRLKGSTGTFAWDNPNLVLPIPAQEVSASSGVIVQNEGY